MKDFELIAQEVRGLGDQADVVEARVARLEARLEEVEKVNARLEAAALTTARSMEQIARHWDAVYEAMRREEELGEEEG